MLFSFAIIFILGLLFSAIFKRLNLPGILGMILVGILIGPYCLNYIDKSVLNISADLRKLALIIILTRAGLTLNISDLKKIGRPAALMSFLPACFEILAVTLIAPLFFDISYIESAIIGSVIAAVSPAIVVPRMIGLIEKGYGESKKIPQLIIAGSSVDDIFVIVIFTALTSVAKGGEFTVGVLAEIPISIILGIVLGIISGLILYFIFSKFVFTSTIKVLIILSVSFILVEIENRLTGIVPVSGLLAIMSMGITINNKHVHISNELKAKYNNLWVAGELLLFVLVGATVNISYALPKIIPGASIILLALLFRMTAVSLCVLNTNLNSKERLFCMLAYTPKATVQAAIGAIPLAMNLECGEIVLTMAVISILITAPIGAISIDLSYKKLLKKLEDGN